MSEHHVYIARIKNLHPHSNADKLQVGEVFGTQVIVSLDYTEGQLGVYCPADLQLSEEFCEVNHLCTKHQDGTPDTGYMDPNKRNVKTIRLRGLPSDGIFLPLAAIAYTSADLHGLSEGDHFDELNGHKICCQYIPRGKEAKPMPELKGNRARKRRDPISPLFREHADTEYIDYHLDAFRAGDIVEITLKMHGTSQRTGYLPVLTGYTSPNPVWASLFRRLCGKQSMGRLTRKIYALASKHVEPVYEYGYITGTRRTVLSSWDGGFYGSNSFREQHAKKFEGKLRKGETAYYEVCGWVDHGTPIMPSSSKNKLVGSDFVKQYGETTDFTYGCARGESDIYVYRMTYTTPEGDVIEYPPDYMRYRCEQMGIKSVPVLKRLVIPKDFIMLDGNIDEYPESQRAGAWVKHYADAFVDGPDPIGKTHVREGVVIRIVNRPAFTAWKEKGVSFKILEGLIKETAEHPDIEEMDETLAEEARHT